LAAEVRTTRSGGVPSLSTGIEPRALLLQRFPGGTGYGDGGNSGKSGLADAENPARLSGEQLQLGGGEVCLPLRRGNRKHFLRKTHRQSVPDIFVDAYCLRRRCGCNST
jgi:hypothetical protein